LVYFNIDHVRDTITAGAEVAAAKLVVLDLSSAPRVDLHAAETLDALRRELAATGIRLQIVGAHAAVRDKLRQMDLDDKTGPITRHTSVADAVDSFLEDSLQTS
jgi:MFS superfamily sulfate permease-like transporter